MTLQNAAASVLTHLRLTNCQLLHTSHRTFGSRRRNAFRFFVFFFLAPFTIRDSNFVSVSRKCEFLVVWQGRTNALTADAHLSFIILSVSPFASPAFTLVRSRAMPLNTTSFLVSQGWEGVGVPLDGKAGKGLKKPLAITQKKTLSGIGKDRDRADDWWNSIFTAGAKSLSIGPSPASSGASTPTLDKSKPSTSTTSWSMGERSAASATMSLSSLAKREHARKTLMSNFVRGKPIVPAVEPIDNRRPPSAAPPKTNGTEVVAAADDQVDAALNITSSTSPASIIQPSDAKVESESKSKSANDETDAQKLARRLAKKALRKQLKASRASSSAAEGSQLAPSQKSKKSKEANKDRKDKKNKAGKKEKKKKKFKAENDLPPAPIEPPTKSNKRKRTNVADDAGDSKKLKENKAEKKDRDKAEKKKMKEKHENAKEIKSPSKAKREKKNRDEQTKRSAV